MPVRMDARWLMLLLIVLTALTGCAQSKTVAGDSLPDGAVRSGAQWWAYPLPSGKVISGYGRRDGRTHTGTDIKTRPNDDILAAFDGRVVFAGKYGGYGNLIRIEHPCGLETYYSHNSKNLVSVGDSVRAGQRIALTGRTGRASTEHLHFETRKKGRYIDSNKFFDHQQHTIRLKAFRKTKDGYVAK